MENRAHAHTHYFALTELHDPSREAKVITWKKVGVARRVTLLAGLPF